jgi:SAM-dependent methyltransferase
VECEIPLVLGESEINAIAQEYGNFQDPLHLYDQEYWNARKIIAGRFTNLVIKPFFNNSKELTSILDLGCGEASFGRCASQIFNAKKFWCIDKNIYQLKQAAKLNIKLKAISKYYELLDFNEKFLPIKSDSIDLVLMINVIYYLKNSKKLRLFKEISRVLKNGGYFILTVENTLFWKNSHPFFPPIPFLWLLPRRIGEKLLIKYGYSSKVDKFGLHYHTSLINYLHLLKKVNPKNINILLTNTIEYNQPLFDHATIPFPYEKKGYLTVNSSKFQFLEHFAKYSSNKFGDKVYDKFIKILVKLGLKSIVSFFAPRVVLIVKF